MDCRAIEELMSLSIDGMLNDEEQQQLNTHLEECSECREIYALYQSVQATLADEEPASLPERFHDDLMNRIREEKVVPLKRRFHYKQWNIAAAVVILIAFGWIGYNNMNMYQQYTTETNQSVMEKAAETTEETETTTESTEDAPAMDVMTTSEPLRVMEESSTDMAVAEYSMDSDEAMVSDDVSDMAVMNEVEPELAMEFTESTSVIEDGVGIATEEAAPAAKSLEVAGEKEEHALSETPTVTAGRAETSEVTFKSETNDERNVTDTTSEQNIPYNLLILIGSIVVLFGGVTALVIKLIKGR